MHIIEWFVQNVIGKAAELFLDFLRLAGRATGVFNDFIEIGFLPSLALISISCALWFGMDYYNLTIQKKKMKHSEYKKKMSSYRRSMVVAAMFAAFFLYTTSLGYAVHRIGLYIYATLFYVTVFIRLIYFMFNLWAERSQKCE
jgi:hypothetical protein